MFQVWRLPSDLVVLAQKGGHILASSARLFTYLSLETSRKCGKSARRKSSALLVR